MGLRHEWGTRQRGLIKHGKNVEIKQGQAFHAFVEDDILLLPAS